MTQHSIGVDLLHSLLDDLAEQLQNEANQSIRQRAPDKGFAALGGIDALHRLEQRLQSQGVLFHDRRTHRGKVSPLRALRA